MRDGRWEFIMSARVKIYSTAGENSNLCKLFVGRLGDNVHQYNVGDIHEVQRINSVYRENPHHSLDQERPHLYNPQLAQILIGTILIRRSG